MAERQLKIRETGATLDVSLHVLPRSRQNQIVGIHDGALKLKVTAPPVDDAANEAVLRFFSLLLDVPRSRLRIISGGKSRDKILRIEGVSLHQFLSTLPSNPSS